MSGFESGLATKVRFLPGEHNCRSGMLSAALLRMAGHGYCAQNGAQPVPGSTLADRLAVVRAAERQAGLAHACGHVGCATQASSREHGVWFCQGHAGFAAVGR